MCSPSSAVIGQNQGIGAEEIVSLGICQGAMGWFMVVQDAKSRSKCGGYFAVFPSSATALIMKLRYKIGMWISHTGVSDGLDGRVPLNTGCKSPLCKMVRSTNSVKHRGAVSKLRCAGSQRILTKERSLLLRAGIPQLHPGSLTVLL